jgi:hypothetical protein
MQAAAAAAVAVSVQVLLLHRRLQLPSIVIVGAAATVAAVTAAAAAVITGTPAILRHLHLRRFLPGMESHKHKAALRKVLLLPLWRLMLVVQPISQ